jgi:hypothetical protein
LNVFQAPIAVINRSSVVADSDAAKFAAAAEVQANRDFAPLWGVGATVTFVPKGQDPPPGSWWLVLLDDSDQAGAGGYHETTDQDQPIGKVFCKTVVDLDMSWTVDASHELLEMLGDPHINKAAVAGSPDGQTNSIYAYESCDACEDDQFGYRVDGVLLTDFVTPWWFDPNATQGVRLDFRGHITTPLQILPGGYIGVLNTHAQWTQKFADGATGEHHSSTAAFAGNRWHRRSQPTAGGKVRSTAHTALQPSAMAQHLDHVRRCIKARVTPVVVVTNEVAKSCECPGTGDKTACEGSCG